MSDIEKYHFVESTIKSGISMFCKGYAEVSNKFLKLCNVNKPTSYIIYLHANNFCGHSMMQPLPAEILDLVNPKDFSLDNYSNDSPTICFSGIDLDYPDELQDIHSG